MIFRRLLLFIVLGGQAAAAIAQGHSVLLIHSYHAGMPWTDAQQKGFADVLGNSGLHVDLYVEYLDSLRFRERKDVMRENLSRSLFSKFKDHPPDVIAVTDNNALDFVLDERPRLAPGVPVVFCGINGLSPDIRRRYKNLTGVAEEAAFKETLDVMERLLPGRRVLVLGEHSPTFRGNFESLRKGNAQRHPPARLEVFADPVLSHLEARVRRAGPDTLVFILNRPVDDRGQTVDSAVAVRAISSASKQPVFSVWDYMFGHGIVGGKLTSGEAHGETAAKQVIRIVNGEPADSIPIEWESANRYFFDYRQLRRFGLQDELLPEGSVVINRPLSFYTLHRDKVLAVAGVFVLLMLLGARLLVLNKSLRESRNLLDSIISNIPVMLFLKRASDLSFVLFNRAGEALLGRSRDELLGRNDYDFFPKEQADFFTGKDREVLQQKDVLDIAEEPIETAKGPRILHTRKLALRNREGQATYLLGISEDVTERKRAEEELKQYKSQLEEKVQQRTSELLRQQVFMQAVLENINDGIVACDEQGRLSYFNRATRLIHGIDQEDLPPERWSEHYRLVEEDGTTPMATNRIPLFRAFNDGQVRDQPLIIVNVDGSRRFMLCSGQAMLGKEGEKLGAVVSMHDVTVQKRVEAELINARDTAEAANHAKSIFLANMSHELRTPLNAILGFSKLIRREPALPARQREHLDIINRSGEHLLALINDVLEIAKIEAGRLQLEIAPFELGDMVSDVADMMRLRAEEKGLRLLLEQSPAFPRCIKGDEARLRQILVNLVGNAVKFTEKGGISIRLGVRREERLTLLIEVEDSGPGISIEDQKRLFRPFVQLTEGGEQKGTGLGLTITKQFVELMGGSISVKSCVGKGSVFRVELPVEAAEAPEAARTEPAARGEVVALEPGQPRYRILIAEDQHENRLLLTQLMSDLGLEVRLAENGEECIRVFEAWQPDLIWMDRRMPVMDGEEAARRIRRLEGGEKVRIVAVTASAFKEEQDEVIAAGMDDFVRKPYRFEEIYDCLARQLGARYLYDGAAMGHEVPPELTPALLSVLPEALRRELRIAVESLEPEIIAAAIRRVGEREPELAQALARSADNFDYPTILDRLDEVKQ